MQIYRLPDTLRFFSKSPQLDLLLLLCCILYITVPPMSPFKKYDLLKNGQTLQAEVTQVYWLPSGTYIDYQYRTPEGSLLKGHEKTFDLDQYGIDKHKLPQKIAIVYVPQRPERSWIDTPRPQEKLETFWRDYLIENGITSLVLYLIIRTAIGIHRYLKRRRQPKEIFVLGQLVRKN